MSVTFTGTAVQWIGPKNNNGGIADVSIDGTQVGHRGHLRRRGQGVPAGAVQPDRAGRRQPHADDHGHRATRTRRPPRTPWSIDAINVPTAAAAGRLLPGRAAAAARSTLDGRDSPAAASPTTLRRRQHLVYSTSELMTQATIGGQATALLYDPDGHRRRDRAALHQPAHRGRALRHGAEHLGRRAAATCGSTTPTTAWPRCRSPAAARRRCCCSSPIDHARRGASGRSPRRPATCWSGRLPGPHRRGPAAARSR